MSERLPVKASPSQGSMVYFFPKFASVISVWWFSINSKTICLWHFLFSVVCSNITANELNNDLQKISEWPYKWKMSLDPDLNKQAQELIFSRKLNIPSHPKIVFSSESAVCADWQKHLRKYLDKTLNFNLHIKEKMAKAMTGIGVTHSRHSLITIFKSFVRPHLDHGILIYDQPINESFIQKFESTQYMLPFQLQVPSKEHLKVSCTVNLVLNLWNLGVGLGNFVLL